MDPELPIGYLEEYYKYNSGINGVKSLWVQLKLWRDFKAGTLLPQQRKDSARDQKIVELLAVKVAEFQAQILKAAFINDRAFLTALLEAANAPSLPSPEIDGYAAALQAFWDLFVHKGLLSRDDWPKKKEVLARAKQILKKGGFADVSPRTWTRIFGMPGLKELEQTRRKSVR